MPPKISSDDIDFGPLIKKIERYCANRGRQSWSQEGSTLALEKLAQLLREELK